MTAAPLPPLTDEHGEPLPDTVQQQMAAIVAEQVAEAEWRARQAEQQVHELRSRIPDDPERLTRRLSIALGLIAPGGTAPAEALHRLWAACEAGQDPRPALGALHRMLEPHYGDWDAVEHPTVYPDPDSDEYASGLSLLEGLRRYRRYAPTTPDPAPTAPTAPAAPTAPTVP